MKIEVKRLDHLGIVAGTIKDLKIVELIDSLVGTDSREYITTGEAVAAMVINGLGYASRVLTLTPQFFETKALNSLIKDGVNPEHFNRFKLGRALDAITEYGTEKLFSTLALQACSKEGINLKYGHADTTSISLTGEYDSCCDLERINVTYGYSKDKRPDLKQIVHELMVAHDGGVPFMAKSWDGNESDNVILRERAKQVIKAFKESDLKCLVADAKLYAAENIPMLKQINFITRIPRSIKQETQVINQALAEDTWEIDHKGNKIREILVNHCNLEQRWIVIHSDQAQERVKKTLNKAVVKEKSCVDKALFHLQAQRFGCEDDARKALKALAKKLSYHRIVKEKINTIKCYEKRGKPKGKPQNLMYQIEAIALFDQDAFNLKQKQRSCFVLSTNMPQEELDAQGVLVMYKGQDKIEKGFAFLKSPEFFASSLYLKKPSRLEGLLMVMTLALLVYSIAQRRLRNQLQLLSLTIPNQIKRPTKTPTMRWVFQLFEGIDHVTVILNKKQKSTIEGINDLRKKILGLLGPGVRQIYQIV